MQRSASATTTTTTAALRHSQPVPPLAEALPFVAALGPRALHHAHARARFAECIGRLDRVGPGAGLP